MHHWEEAEFTAVISLELKLFEVSVNWCKSGGEACKPNACCSDEPTTKNQNRCDNFTLSKVLKI